MPRIAWADWQGCLLAPGNMPKDVPWLKEDIPSLGCLAQIVTSVLGWTLVFLGAVTLLVLIFGAVRFVVSQGDTKAIQEARKTMTYAVIGAVLVLGSFFIINIVTTALGLPNILTGFTIYYP